MTRKNSLLNYLILIIGITMIVTTNGLALRTGEKLTVPTFGQVTIYPGAEPIQRVVLFLSGDGGWNLGVVDMARSFADLHSLVVGIDLPHYLRQLEQEKTSCSYPAGDLEQLSQLVQKRANLPEYLPPVLIGYSSGATVAYAVLAQAPSETFAGGVSLGFCSDLEIQKPFCKGRALTWLPGKKGKGFILQPSDKLEVPWIAFQGLIDQTCLPANTTAFVKQVSHGQIVLLDKVGHGFSVERRWLPQLKEILLQFDKKPKALPPPLPADISNLPLIEMLPGKWQKDFFIVIISGDGGWASIDKHIAQVFIDDGIGVVGFNSLKYLWNRKTPAELARDFGRVLNHYLPAWKKDKALVIGYSLGADVLPFMISPLPEALQKKLLKIVFLGPSQSVDLEFHVLDWISSSSAKNALPLLPEIQKMKNLPMLFVRGDEEDDSLCFVLPPGLGKVVTLHGGHHFGGDYPALATMILQTINLK